MLDSHAFNKLERRLERLVSLQNNHSPGAYKFIPFNSGRFKLILEEAIRQALIIQPEAGKNYKSIKFLDVGCGIGTKLFLAQTLTPLLDVYGLEISKDYAKIASDLTREDWLDGPNPNIIVADALTFPDYSKFDIIYFFCPLQDETLENKLEAKIAADCKPGCVVMAVYNPSNVWGNTKRFTNLGSVFIKKRVARSKHGRQRRKTSSK